MSNKKSDKSKLSDSVSGYSIKKFKIKLRKLTKIEQKLDYLNNTKTHVQNLHKIINKYINNELPRYKNTLVTFSSAIETFQTFALQYHSNELTKYISEFIEKIGALSKIDDNPKIDNGGEIAAEYLQHYLTIIINELESNLDFFEEEIVKYNNLKALDANLLTEVNFKKNYLPELKLGYIPDKLREDIDGFSDINQKIMFINYINRCIDDSIEWHNMSLDLKNLQIDRFEKTEDLKLQEFLNEKVLLEENVAYLVQVKNFLKGEVDFWESQIDKESYFRKNIYDNKSFHICEVKEHLNKIPNIKTKIIYLDWLQREIDNIKLDQIKYFPDNEGTPKEAIAFDEQLRQNYPDRLIEGSYKSDKNNKKIIKFVVKDKTYEVLEKYISKELEFWNKKLILELSTNTSEINEKENQRLKFKDVPKIKWVGTETQIVYLIDELIKNKFLPSEAEREKYKIISEHFTNKDNKNFSPKQLGVTFQNLTGKKPGRGETIDEIVIKAKEK